MGHPQVYCSIEVLARAARPVRLLGAKLGKQTAAIRNSLSIPQLPTEGNCGPPKGKDGAPTLLVIQTERVDHPPRPVFGGLDEARKVLLNLSSSILPSGMLIWKFLQNVEVALLGTTRLVHPRNLKYSLWSLVKH